MMTRRLFTTTTALVWVTAFFAASGNFLFCCCMVTAEISKSSPTTLTPNEIREMTQSWGVIRKACTGCWSGGLNVYKAGRRTGMLKKKAVKGGLNFRLEVKTNAKTGTWTVWNLNKKGDELVVPLTEKYSSTPPSQLKLAFNPGLIFRIPRHYNSAPRLVIEIGFWDNAMRRTAVMEYERLSRWSFLQRWRKLLDITVVQMKREHTSVFVGNTTDDDAICVLPSQAPFGIEKLKLKELRAVSKETIDLRTMERMSYGANAEEADSVLDLLSKRSQQRLCQILPCGICVSLPRKFGGARGEGMERCVFANEGDGGSLQVLILEYDSSTSDALRATLHTYQRRQK